MIHSEIDRRSFMRLGMVGAAGIALPGLGACRSIPKDLPRMIRGPNPATRGNQILNHSANIPIRAGETSAMRHLLHRLNENGGLFAHSTPSVHFARAAVFDKSKKGIDRDELDLSVIFDERIETAMNFLASNGEALDSVLRYCENYVPETALDPASLHAYFDEHKYFADDRLFFTAYDTAEVDVDTSLAVQRDFLDLLRSVQRSPDRELPYLFDRFLVGDESRRNSVGGSRPVHLRGNLPFSPHVSNTLTMVQPLKQGRFDRKKVVPRSNSAYEKVERLLGPHFTYEEVFRAILAGGEWAVRDLHEHPLAPIHTVHFARVAVVDGNMMFASVYDGDFPQYVLDFSSHVADEVDMIWGLTEGYPLAGSRDVGRFIEWIRKGQVDTQAFFSAHGNVTLIQLEKATKLRAKLDTFTRALPPDGVKLRALLTEFVRENAGLLG